MDLLSAEIGEIVASSVAASTIRFRSSILDVTEGAEGTGGTAGAEISGDFLLN